LRIQPQKLRRNSITESAGEESNSWSSQRRKTKVEAFGLFEILPRLGRKYASSGGSIEAIRSTGERDSGLLKFYVQEEHRRSAWER
jgi:hypothetical protein